MNTIATVPCNAADAGRTIATIEHRVPAAEVDGFNVVHFSKYLGWYAVAMIAAFVARGLGPGRFAGNTVEIRVARVQAAYVKSACLDDLVTVDVLRIELRRTGMLVHAQARVGDDLLARARLTIACVSSGDGQLVKLPDEVRQAFEPALQEMHDA